jgi:hypothetical protein
MHIVNFNSLSVSVSVSQFGQVRKRKNTAVDWAQGPFKTQSRKNIKVIISGQLQIG